MTSLKLPQPAEDVSGQPAITLSSRVDSVTGRRHFSLPEMNSAPAHMGRKSCPICGVAMNKDSRFCWTCYQAARKRMVNLRCAHCGKDFERLAYVHEKAIKKGMVDTYCSRECSDADMAVKNAKKCRYCGKPMPSRHTRYCSPECKKAGRPAVPNKLMVTCAWCGITVRAQSHLTQFCSKVCADAAHAVRMRGTGNPHYKTGLSYAKWFAEMRPLISERDHHRCVTCQQPEDLAEIVWSGQTVTRTNLLTHHIDGDTSNNLPENLVLICKKCHAVHHKSSQTPWPWLAAYALGACQSMTSRWKAATTSLRKAYSSTTASSESLTIR